MARRPSDPKSAARAAQPSIVEQTGAEHRAGAMPMKPAVILVGADKGGVGKTTVARVLADYLTGKNILTRAFDTESPRGTLKRFHGDMTEVVDIASTSDQKKILDTLNT